ncbi:hypothetical protein JHK84_043420 [Glycine max]|nr:hypothetical protein JHK84_043420 [Glycine max]
MDVVPSTIHLKIFFYNEDGKLEVSKADQTSYAIYASFVDETDQILAVTAPFDIEDSYYMNKKTGEDANNCLGIRARHSIMLFSLFKALVLGFHEDRKPQHSDKDVEWDPWGVPNDYRCKVIENDAPVPKHVPLPIEFDKTLEAL